MSAFRSKLDHLIEEHAGAGEAHEDLAGHLLRAFGRLIITKAKEESWRDLRARIGLGLLGIFSPELAATARKARESIDIPSRPARAR